MAKSKREVREEAKRLSRELRKRMTRAEKIFWQAVRNRRFLGKRFIRQHPLFHEASGSFWFYIVDFYCPEDRLVVELDGSSHEGKGTEDRERTEIVEANRIRITRFGNEEIDTDISKVLRKLERVLLG